MASAEQPDLFGSDRRRAAPLPPRAESTPGAKPAHQPLAARMRPRTLAEIVGQEHLTAPGALASSADRDQPLWQPDFLWSAGLRQNEFRRSHRAETKSRFVRVNAVMSNVAELREILATARRLPDTPTLLFIDELHRFNKSQQDLLLPDVEEGHVRLIGATTHNPGFYVNPPLLSRSHLFRLEPLSTAAVASVLKHALVDEERGLGARHCSASDAVLSDLRCFATAICGARLTRSR